MNLYLDYINHTDGNAQVDCGIVLGGLRGVRSCTGAAVMAAAEALKDACRAELSGQGSIGSELAMPVEKRPAPAEDPAEDTQSPLTLTSLDSNS